MTQEALKQMYQLLLTEPHAPTLCNQLERIAREALAEHAMRETQRLGQEIEQELKIKTTDPFESSRVADYNMGWNDCLFASGVVKQTEQEPVAWQWLGSAHFRKKLPKNADITAWNPLYTAPPQRTWVALTEQQRNDIEDACEMIIGKPAFDLIDAALKGNNT
jgi:hypothetical protein